MEPESSESYIATHPIMNNMTSIPKLCINIVYAFIVFTPKQSLSMLLSKWKILCCLSISQKVIFNLLLFGEGGGWSETESISIEGIFYVL
jgi:hypothetical protein